MYGASGRRCLLSAAAGLFNKLKRLMQAILHFLHIKKNLNN